MMKTIVEEKLVSFKTLEQKIYKYICTYGAELTRTGRHTGTKGSGGRP